jgi:hypothetical protein
VFKRLLTAARSRFSDVAPWRRLLAIPVLVLSLGYLGYKVWTSWDALANYRWQIRYVYLVPSFALFVVQLVVATWGWQSIMNRLARPAPFRSHIKVYGYTNLMRRIPAGVVWMIAGRAYGYRDQNIAARASVLGSVIELIVIVLTGLPLAALAGWSIGLLSPTAGIGIASAILALSLVVLHPAVLRQVCRWVRHELPPTGLGYRHTLTWALIYLLIWLISGAGLFIVAALFTDLAWTSLPTIIGIWIISNLISYLMLLSPSGLGVKETSLAFLLGFALPDPLPLLIALAIRVIWTVYDLLVGAGVLLL